MARQKRSTPPLPHDLSETLPPVPFDAVQWAEVSEKLRLSSLQSLVAAFMVQELSDRQIARQLRVSLSAALLLMADVLQQAKAVDRRTLVRRVLST